MKYEVVGNPDFGDLTVFLEPGEGIWAESGAMSRMSRHLDVNVHMIGGMLKAIARKMVGGESLFVAEYSCPEKRDEDMFVSFAPSIPGTIMHRRMDGEESFYLTAGAFLACTPGLDIDVRFGGLKAFFSGEGAFFMEVSGEGDLWFNAYGGVVEKTIDGKFTVDTGHLVAWEPTLDYKIGGMGGLKSTLLSGEGLVMKFSGQGKIYLQTRHIKSMAQWVNGYF